MSTNKYERHQRSKYARYTQTSPSGKMIQADSQEKLDELTGKNKPKSVQSFEVPVNPKYDPDTGERIN